MSSGGFAHQDWEPVTFKSKPKPITGSGASKATAIAQAKRAGASVAIEKKCKCTLYVWASPVGEVLILCSLRSLGFST